MSDTPAPNTSLQSVRELLSPRGGSPRVCNLIQREMNGGVTTKEQLAALDDLPQVNALKVSGLTSATLQYLVARYPTKFEVLELFKCPQLTDLSPLEGLTSLTHVLMYHNKKATRLWDFRKTPALIGLDFSDFVQLKDLQDLAVASSLRDLEFGNMVWNRASYASLEPLAVLQGLQRLRFNATEIDDQRIQPLAALAGLHELSFPAALFTREQLAWLRARLPVSVQSNALTSHQSCAAMPTKSGRRNDSRVNGRGERAYDNAKDRELLEIKAREFERLVQRFTDDPLAQPQG